MKQLLAAAAFVAFLPAAHAQDRGKSDFSAGGEFRVRDNWIMNEKGNKDTKPANNNSVLQRFKLGLNFKATEKLSAHATLIQAAAWGQADSESIGDRGTVAGAGLTDPHERNFMSVNEAYGKWMISDDFNAKFGRMGFGFGDGSVMSINDWEQRPYSFDGVTLTYEAEFGKFTSFMFKYREYGLTTAINSTGAGNSTVSDPEHNAYGIVFDLKTKPETLTMINAHVIQDTGDAVWGQAQGSTVNSMGNMNITRAGVTAAAGFAGFDLKGGYEMMTGKVAGKDVTGAVSTASQQNVQASMMQAEIGYTASTLMGSRWFVGYHQDTGGTTSATDTKLKTYDPYFADQYDFAGKMQLIAWGNLTYLNAGWTLKPADHLDVGLKFYMYSKTNDQDIVHAGANGGGTNADVNGNGLFGKNSTKIGEKAIGNEVNVWAEHHYDRNFSILASIGHFMPGASMKHDSINKKDAISQVLVQGRMTF